MTQGQRRLARRNSRATDCCPSGPSRHTGLSSRTTAFAGEPGGARVNARELNTKLWQIALFLRRSRRPTAGPPEVPAGRDEHKDVQHARQEPADQPHRRGRPCAPTTSHLATDAGADSVVLHVNLPQGPRIEASLVHRLGVDSDAARPCFAVCQQRSLEPRSRPAPSSAKHRAAWFASAQSALHQVDDARPPALRGQQVVDAQPRRPAPKIRDLRRPEALIEQEDAADDRRHARHQRLGRDAQAALHDDRVQLGEQLAERHAPSERQQLPCLLKPRDAPRQAAIRWNWVEVLPAEHGDEGWPLQPGLLRSRLGEATVADGHRHLEHPALPDRHRRERHRDHGPAVRARLPDECGHLGGERVLFGPQEDKVREGHAAFLQLRGVLAQGLLADGHDLRHALRSQLRKMTEFVLEVARPRRQPARPPEIIQRPPWRSGLEQLRQQGDALG
mmetsp:Transcript_61442/g.187661  ORF Transcript_61442/g.187661 Transcript_61442/m.187661 type:complete len:447 (-) Transcript_61442:955-2295(-)